MGRKLLILWILSGVIGLLWSCSAPHDNPLDPASNHYIGNGPTPPNLRVQVRSVHNSYNFPTYDTYTAVPELWGSDASQLDSVWVTYDSLFTRELNFDTLADTLWSTRLDASVFGDAELYSVAGHPFLFSVRDVDGAIWNLPAAYVWRVIHELPEVNAPSAYDTVSAFPTLAWQPFSQNFPFVYMISIMTDSLELPVWAAPPLPSGVLSIQCLDSLPDNNYEWIITVVDEYGNSSRSKQGTFVVRG